MSPNISRRHSLRFDNAVESTESYITSCGNNHEIITLFIEDITIKQLLQDLWQEISVETNNEVHYWLTRCSVVVQLVNCSLYWNCPIRFHTGVVGPLRRLLDPRPIYSESPNAGHLVIFQ